MIRKKHYAEHIAPYASRLGQELGPVRLHSCGKSDHLLDVIARIDNLGVLDTGSNTSVSEIRKHLGDIQIDLAPPVEILLENGNEDQIDVWLENIFERE